MEVTMVPETEKRAAESTEFGSYRENVRKLVQDELRKTMDEEIQKGVRELEEEQRKAIRQILEDQKAIVRQVIEEEKKKIWNQAESLRQSLMRFSL